MASTTGSDGGSSAPWTSRGRSGGPPIDDAVRSLLQTVEGSDDEASRRAALDLLAESGSPDATRVLIEAWERAAWRETRVAILHALGRLGHERGVEHLVRVVGDETDLALGAEAVLALGVVDQVAVGELLASVIESGDAAHRREAIIAASRSTTWPFGRLFERALPAARDAGASGLAQYLVLGLGLVGSPSAWEHVEACLVDPASPPAVVNAALVAAGRLADAGGMQRLAELTHGALRFRFFAQQLAAAALAHARARALLTVEDAVEGARRADGPALRDALQLLSGFPAADAREAFAVLAADAPVARACAVRAVTARAQWVDDDVSFLVREGARLDPEAAASLAVALREVAGDDAVATLHSALPPTASLAMMARVREPAATARLVAIVGDEAAPSTTRVSAVNALVAQARMGLSGSAHAQQVADDLFTLARGVKDPHVELRLLRALGQVGASTGPVLMNLEQRLRPKDRAFGSAAYALSLMGTPEASRVLQKRLRTLRGRTGVDAEVGHLLTGLARVGTPVAADSVAGLSPEGRRERLSLLQVLGRSRVDGFAPLLSASLASDDFAERLLAIAACRENSDPSLHGPLLEAHRGDNACLAQRARYSLCATGDAPVYEELLRWALLPETQPKESLSILRGLVVEPGFPVAPLVALVDEALRARPPVTADEEVATALVHLRDMLLLRDRTEAPTPGAAHSVDAELTQRLPGFARLSEAARSVLRNAELTHHHTDLFDERVDKSTILVEYVKTIDLLLQEKVGGPLFHRSPRDPDLLLPMRSRIVQLGLDDESLTTAELLGMLQCGPPYLPEDLHVAKIVGVCRAIVTGRVERNPYRIVDGLRAWSILLLLFGREFTCRGTKVAPILGLRDTTNRQVARLCVNLGRLQDVRNQAAHRGTIRRLEDLAAARALALDVLEELDEVL